MEKVEEPGINIALQSDRVSWIPRDQYHHWTTDPSLLGELAWFDQMVERLLRFIRETSAEVRRAHGRLDFSNTNFISDTIFTEEIRKHMCSLVSLSEDRIRHLLQVLEKTGKPIISEKPPSGSDISGILGGSNVHKKPRHRRQLRQEIRSNYARKLDSPFGPENIRKIDNRTTEQITEMEKDIGKSAMEEQLPRVDFKFAPEMEAEVLMESETDEQHEELTAVKSQEGMMGRGKSAIQEQEMAVEVEERGKSDMQDDWKTEELFASYRHDWESTWGGLSDLFRYMTTVSSMQFTHFTPGRIPKYGACPVTTLQIFSVKIALKESAKFPLSVYGLVAARDYVDHNRNFLFCCQRTDSKELTKEDPFLPLIGPSRAVLCTEPVDFEIQLKVKGTTESQDRVLITDRQCLMSSSYNSFSAISLENRFCIAEISFEKLRRSVQATMLGVRVIQSATWPFEFGGRVACYSPIRKGMNTDSEGDLEANNPQSYEVVLLDYKGAKMPVGSDGYLHLSRHVVSVELHRLQSNILNYEESLQVVIQAYNDRGTIAEESHVNFQSKLCNISHGDCMLRGSKLEITVAWSCLARKESIALEGFVDGLEGYLWLMPFAQLSIQPCQFFVEAFWYVCTYYIC